jgi:hypothetical protein
LPKNNCFHYFWCKISSYGVAAWKWKFIRWMHIHL